MQIIPTLHVTDNPFFPFLHFASLSVVCLFSTSSVVLGLLHAKTHIFLSWIIFTFSEFILEWKKFYKGCSMVLFHLTDLHFNFQQVYLSFFFFQNFILHIKISPPNACLRNSVKIQTWISYCIFLLMSALFVTICEYRLLYTTEQLWPLLSCHLLYSIWFLVPRNCKIAEVP